MMCAQASLWHWGPGPATKNGRTPEEGIRPNSFGMRRQAIYMPLSSRCGSESARRY